jgi:hypothetical protein
MNTESKPTIDINDLVSVVQIIDVCSTRGAFRGEELAIIGALRTKIAEIIKANTPATPDAPKPE